MGFIRKIFGLECKYLGTGYCPIGDMNNHLCHDNLAKWVYNIEGKDVECYRTARANERKTKTDLAKLCVD